MKYGDLISVVIPIYNAEKYIKKSVMSVLNQSYQFFELIIVDDNSKDTSLLIVEQLAKQDKRIKILKRKINFGSPALPRNDGIKKAKSEFIAFLDSSDIWHKDKLQKSVKILSNHNKIDILYHNESHINLNGIKKTHKFPQINNESPYEFLLYGNQISTSSAIVRVSKLFSTGAFSLNKDFISSESYDLWLRLAISGAFFYILKEVLTEKQYRKNSLSADRKKHSNALFNVYKKHIKYIYDAKVINFKEYLNYIHIFFLLKDFYLVKKEFHSKKIDKAFLKLLKAIQKNFTLDIYKIKFCISFILKRRKVLNEAKEIELF